ncbi:hypothetical protein HY792_06285 [Candidatus Desantisbacteria bacterium]|nr:hypothetical protein [Candidatus Desantisbacteria bacterium]
MEHQICSVCFPNGQMRVSNSHFGINLVAQDSILAYPSPFYKANIECWATFLAF